MELRQLHSFVELAKTLNFSRAAERLYIAQPTLSQQIAALEDELQVTLFQRTRRKVDLTFAGKKYLDYCLQVFALLDEAAAEARRAERGEEGQRAFLFGIDESATALDKDGFFDIVEQFQQKFRACHSKIKFMPYRSIMPALANGEIDVGVGITTAKERRGIPFQTLTLSRQAVVLCVPNAYYDQYRAQPEVCIRRACEELDLCLLSSDQRWADHFKEMMQGIGLPFHPLFLNGYNNICTYVQAGKGTMLDIEFAVTPERRDFCTSVPLTTISAEAEVFSVLLWNEANQNPMVPAFLSLFEGRCAPEGGPRP